MKACIIMYPLFMAGWMSAFRCQMLPIPSKSQPQILLKTARRHTWPGSSRWRGAGPRIPRSSQSCWRRASNASTQGKRNRWCWTNGGWTWSKWVLNDMAIPQDPLFFIRKSFIMVQEVSLVRFDFRGHWVFLQSSHQKLGPQLTQISRMGTTGSVPLFWHDWFLFTVPNASKCHVKGHCSALIFIIDSSRLRGWDPQPACCSKIFWFLFPFLISSNFYFSSGCFLNRDWIGWWCPQRFQVSSSTCRVFSSKLFCYTFPLCWSKDSIPLGGSLPLPRREARRAGRTCGGFLLGSAGEPPEASKAADATGGSSRWWALFQLEPRRVETGDLDWNQWDTWGIMGLWSGLRWGKFSFLWFSLGHGAKWVCRYWPAAVPRMPNQTLLLYAFVTFTFINALISKLWLWLLWL